MGIGAMTATSIRVFAAEDSTVIFSQDNGDSWMKTGMLFPSAVTTLAVLGWNLFAILQQGGIYRSTDSGSTWVLVVNGSFLCIANKDIYAFSVGITYRSTDSGSSWIGTNDDLFQPVYCLASCGNSLFVGTDGASVWQLPISDFDAVSTVPPPSLTQIQTYPNPFSQSATITFSSQDEGYAEIDIVNLLGAQVVRIFSGGLTADEHSFTWNASGMAPGMYECIVQMNGNIQRLPMMLSK